MERRVILAFALAPAVVPLAAAAVALATGVPAPESLVIASIYAAFTYGAAIVLGVPCHALLLRRGWRRWWHSAAGGAAIGLAPWVVLAVATPELRGDGRPALACAAAGVASATVFWLIALRERA